MHAARALLVDLLSGDGQLLSGDSRISGSRS
jgi:hypothetical protein